MNWSSKWDEAVPQGINGSKTILNFQDGNKRRSIDVTIVGDLALDYDDDGWNIYHGAYRSMFYKGGSTLEYS